MGQLAIYTCMHAAHSTLHACSYIALIKSKVACANISPYIRNRNIDASGARDHFGFHLHFIPNGTASSIKWVKITITVHVYIIRL